MKINKPLGISIVKDGFLSDRSAYWYIVVCTTLNEKTRLYGWNNTFFGFTDRLEAKRRAEYIASYLNVPYVPFRKCADWVVLVKK